MSKNDKAAKAAMLTELLGEARVATLRESGVLPKAKADKPDSASVAWHRNRLIEKFRERGLLSTKAEKPEATPSAAKMAKKAAPEFSPGGIGARLAKHLDPERLADEHPAVIALFLRSQTPQLRSQVLRGLPGGQARAVMRILRAGISQQPVPKQQAKQKDSEQIEAPTPKPRLSSGTRRAR